MSQTQYQKPRRHESKEGRYAKFKNLFIRFLVEYQVFLVAVLGLSILPLMFGALMVLLFEQDLLTAALLIGMALACAISLKCLNGE